MTNTINGTGSDAPNNTPHDHGDREDNLVRRLGRLARAMRGHLETTIAEVPGRMSAWWVLRHLHNAGPQAQADIAESLGIAGSTLTRRLEQMEADGLITRTADADDKRRIIVALSEKGEAIRADLRERAEADAGRMTAGIEPADFEAFERVLERIRQNLRDLGTDPDARGHGRGGGRGYRSGFGPGIAGRGEGRRENRTPGHGRGRIQNDEA